MRNKSGIQLLVFLVLATGWVIPVHGADWPMRQKDMYNTGRAEYSVPEERMNDTFFDVFLWQTSSPGPGDLSSTSMAFFDGAGPDDADIVVGTYHWPKGVQGMDRHTGETFWTGNPDGGEMIGTITPAFSPDGGTIYVINDATGSPPNPLMAFSSRTGPSSFWHNGAKTLVSWGVFHPQLLRTAAYSCIESETVPMPAQIAVLPLPGPGRLRPQ